MNLRRLGLLIIVASLLVPTVKANIVAEDYEVGDITVTAEGQIVPNKGYWVFGEVLNDESYNIQEVVVEVTTYDQNEGLLDTLTITMTPNIIDAGTKAPFFVKSTVNNQVYDVRVRLLSYKETEFSNFPYIEISKVSEVSEGKITGTVKNTHPTINLNEVEIIATFYDYQGFIDDIQTYGVNEYGVFEAGASKAFTIQSDLWTPYSVSLIPNCDLYSRDPTLVMNISEKTLIINENQRIDFIVYPKLPDSIITVTFYPPSGGAFPHNAHLYLDGTYYVNTKPNEIGEYTVSMAFLPILVNQSRGYVEGAYIEDTFIVKEAPVTVPPTSTGSNTTKDTGSGVDTITDTITEQITNKIPGYPMVSIILSLAALSGFYKRRL